MSAPVGIGIIGCGLMGRRRARTAVEHADTVLCAVTDTDPERAATLARDLDTVAVGHWRDVLARDDVDAVAVCTPNRFLVPIACAALERGRHVLLEKPVGRNVDEAMQLAHCAARHQRVVKIGFNHRYHPALARAHALFRDGAIGALLHVRARYGHGARPGMATEWRADAESAGGGELLDQGVHIIDLLHWFAGAPIGVQAAVQTAVWPISPLEDNAFGLLRFAGGVVGQFHVSMTQWRNLFSFEVHGTTGALVVEGLGGSYGVERLMHVKRNEAGGAPMEWTVRFDGPDESWREEWSDFVTALRGGGLRHGSVEDGVEVMRTVAALYEAAGSSLGGSAGAAVTVRLS